jgi:hypothetical protein
VADARGGGEAAGDSDSEAVVGPRGHVAAARRGHVTA